MRSFVLVSVLGLFCLSAQAQTMEWVMPIGLNFPPNGDFSSTAMTADANGQVAIIGISSIPFLYGSQVFGDLGLLIIDPSGNVTTNVEYEGFGSVESIVEHGGSYFVIGHFKDSLQFPGHPQLVVSGEPNNIGSYACRIEASGTVTWMKDLDELGALGGVSAIAVSDAGILHLSAWDFVDSMILLVDADGELVDIWEQSGVGLISDISVNASGAVAIAGSCLSPEVDLNGTPITAPNDYTIFTARYSADGVLHDHLIIGDVTCPSPSVVLDDANKLYFCADAFIETPAGPFMIQDPEWVFGTFVLQIDGDGVVTWLQQPGPGVALGDVARGAGTDLVLHPDGGVWQGGSARGTNDWGNGVVTSAAIPGNSLYFWQIDDEGRSVQVITGDEPDFLQSVHSLAIGGDALYVLGTGYDTLHLGGTTMPAQDHHLHLSRWDMVSTGVSEVRDPAALSLFPNPARGQVTIDLAKFTGTVYVELRDAQGRLVRAIQHGGGGHCTMDLSGIPPALYIMRTVGRDHIGTAKLMVK